MTDVTSVEHAINVSGASLIFTAIYVNPNTLVVDDTVANNTKFVYW